MNKGKLEPEAKSCACPNNKARKQLDFLPPLQGSLSNKLVEQSSQISKSSQEIVERPEKSSESLKENLEHVEDISKSAGEIVKPPEEVTEDPLTDNSLQALKLHSVVVIDTAEFQGENLSHFGLKQLFKVFLEIASISPFHFLPGLHSIGL